MTETAGQTVRSPRRLSLRLRLTIYLSAVALVTQTLLGVIVLYFQYTAIDGLFNSRVGSRADSLLYELRQTDFRVDDERLTQLTRQNPRLDSLDRVEAVLYAPTGEVIASSVRPAPNLDVLLPGALKGNSLEHRIAASGAFPGTSSSAPARLGVRRVSDRTGKEYILAVVAGDWSFAAVAEVVRRVLLVGGAIGLVTWIVAAWLIAGLAMSPIRELRAVAESFSPEGIERDVQFPSVPSPEVEALERDLRESRARLRSALHAQDRFMSNVSHELNTPIAVLLTEAQTLRCDTLSPEARAFAQSVTDEMQRLGRMVGSFLVLTRIRGGQKLTALAPCAVNELVMDALQACASTASQSGVSILPRLASEEPSLAVCGDVTLLHVMLDNLLRNALRHTPRGRQISVAVSRVGADCIIAVRDPGPPMSESQMNAAFDHFSDAPRHSGGRSRGLGLSVAQGIAELHGGLITVSNVPAGGCEFAAKLPAAQQPAAVDPCAA